MRDAELVELLVADMDADTELHGKSVTGGGDGVEMAARDVSLSWVRRDSTGTAPSALSRPPWHVRP
jgi:hypothetical protein